MHYYSTMFRVYRAIKPHYLLLPSTYNKAKRIAKLYGPINNLFPRALTRMYRGYISISRTVSEAIHRGDKNAPLSMRSRMQSTEARNKPQLELFRPCVSLFFFLLLVCRIIFAYWFIFWQYVGGSFEKIVRGNQHRLDIAQRKQPKMIYRGRR